MPSSRLRRAGVALAVVVCASSVVASARAQTPAQGFAVDRFYSSAPGAGWMVMDDLDMQGKLGGVVALSGGWAHAPLRVTSGGQRTSVVSDQGFADVGLAVTHDRFRLYVNFTSPLWLRGEDAAGAYAFTAPSLDPAQNPDTLSDVRIGLDTRLFGTAKSPLRVGVGWQLFVPSGDRNDYVTDGTYRGMGRLLFAGNVGLFSFAGHVGVHIRPRDEGAVPGGPHGNELLFGLAGGPKIPIAGGERLLVVGPEIFGERAVHSLFGSTATGVEALLTARLEPPRDEGPQLRFKIGVGGGLHPQFGAPEWRFVIGVELSDRLR